MKTWIRHVASSRRGRRLIALAVAVTGTIFLVVVVRLVRVLVFGRPRSSSSGAVLDLASRLESDRAAHKLPSIAAAVFVGDAVVSEAAVGVRKLGAPAAVTTADKWHIGSCTKAMTATLMAMLVDEGKLDWSTTVAEVFGPSEATGLGSVTVDELLTHRSGLDANLSPGLRSDAWRAAEAGEAPDKARTRIVRELLMTVPPNPRGAFRYSNAGYVVLGGLLERVTGVSWEVLITQRLFAPLEMRSCGFGSPASPDSLDGPWGHLSRNGQLVPVPPGVRGDNPAALGPAGAVHCSLVDWNRFVQMHLRGDRGEPTLVSPRSIAHLHLAREGGYAGGWVAESRAWAGGPALHHAGSNTMFFASVWAVPRTGLAMYVATNAAPDGVEPTVDGLFEALIDRYAR